MTANVFVSKLKADGSKNDLTDLAATFSEYKDILASLGSKDRGLFSLNVLCTLCRNLEKIPSWRSQIDCKALLTLSIECVRGTYNLEIAERIKTLACIYHIHRYVVRQAEKAPPELILKLSYMPFTVENLLNDYCKTYWNILADRITYLEQLKTQKKAIHKLFTKLTEDITLVVKMYNTVQFCLTALTYLVKKLHVLYNDLCKTDLNMFYATIFEVISTKDDLKYFKKLQEVELLDIYQKLMDCFYVIGENALKLKFKDSALVKAVKTCVIMLGHRPDILHCLQTFFCNGFCSILTTEANITYTETMLTNLPTSCETTEKLGYKKAMTATYPFINQMFKLFIEFAMTIEKTEQIQIAMLKLMEFLMQKLKNCSQIVKCDNCTVKSGLHDSLKSSFIIKSYLAKSLQDQNVSTKIMPAYYSIILQQYAVLQELRKLGCNNYEKCYKKVQADVHNIAIDLNKSQNYDYSIKLVDIYVNNEIVHFKNENDLKNISRALYNKSICEMDSKLYENALSDAYLSLVFAYPEGLSSVKYMSLVMDIKAKVLKVKDDDDNDLDDLQMMTVLDACADAIEKKKYGNLKPFFCNLKFSELLTHEFSLYVKLWPSLAPIAGVWRTLYDLTQHDVPWLIAKDESIEKVLYDIILETPSAVRNIQNEHISDIITEFLDRFEGNHAKSLEEKVLYGTLLFLKAEFDLAEASQKYGWKVTDPNPDPDQTYANCTFPQEHEASKTAVKAVTLWTNIIREMRDHARPALNLSHVLNILQVYVPQLLHLYRIPEGLQLASICCQFAEYIGDKESYIRNLSQIIYLANIQTDELTKMIAKGNIYCEELMKSTYTMETVLVYLCLCALYYYKTGLVGLSVRLAQVVQAKILVACEKMPDLNLDLPIGMLLELQSHLGSTPGIEPSTLTNVTRPHRHFITCANTATTHTTRRHRSLTQKLHISHTGVYNSEVCRHLVLGQRLRAGGAHHTAAQAAARAGWMHLVSHTAKIDNGLKYILGLQSSTDQPTCQPTHSKEKILFTPKQELETMLEGFTFRKRSTSPMSHLSIPGHQTPSFMTHGDTCQCYACQNFFIYILTCQTIGLEAAIYFRCQENEIARNYFDGALKCLALTEEKLKKFEKSNFVGYVVGVTKKMLHDQFLRVQTDILMQAAFFELSQANYKEADGLIVKIHEILQENNVSLYVKNEVQNLLITSARLRQETKEIQNLEIEFDSLRLSPTKVLNPAKTPEAKAEKPPKLPKIKVKDEEVPNRRKVIKLNFDEEENQPSATKTVKKRTEFKIPVPVTNKPVLETITPTPKRKIPDIQVTASTSIFDVATPKTHNVTQFSTPLNETVEQFFTPETSVKTYTKKSLRQNIVKKLEEEFSTPLPLPKPDKENKCQKSESKAKKLDAGPKTTTDKKTLRRATSPGKLETEKKVTRSRLRQPQI